MYPTCPIHGPFQRPTLDDVPARVKVAITYLEEINEKTAPKIALSDTTHETVDGQELSGPEIQAQTAACNLLTQYFQGKLEPSLWESAQLAQSTALDDNHQPLPAEIKSIECPFCKGKGCPMCLNKGRLMWSAVRGG